VTAFGLSVGISPREPTRRIGDLAQAAEAAGFDAAWILDSHLVMRDVYVSLATAAHATSKIKLGTGVTNPLTRHITVTANAISTVHELSAGRAMLGLGTGDSSVFPLGMKPATAKELGQYVTRMRALVAGESVRIGEEDVTLTVGEPDVPIFVAASRARMLKVAGSVADGVIVLGVAQPDFLAHQLEMLNEGIAASGRARSDVFIDYWVTMSISDDEERAVRDVKSWASGQARWLDSWKSLPDSLARYREDAARAATTYSFKDHLSLSAEHASAVSDDFARLVAVAGNLETCVERIRELARLDVDRITFTLLSGGREARLENLGRLIARLKETTGVSGARDRV